MVHQSGSCLMRSLSACSQAPSSVSSTFRVSPLIPKRSRFSQAHTAPLCLLILYMSQETLAAASRMACNLSKQGVLGTELLPRCDVRVR